MLPLFFSKMQSAVLWATTAAGKLVIHSAISPMVHSTLSVITSLRTNSANTHLLQQTIDEYVNSFIKLYGRNPIVEEIRTYFQTYMSDSVSINDLETYLHDYAEYPEA